MLRPLLLFPQPFFFVSLFSVFYILLFVLLFFCLSISLFLYPFIPLLFIPYSFRFLIRSPFLSLPNTLSPFLLLPARFL
jgi:hypothetical protein